MPFLISLAGDISGMASYAAKTAILNGMDPIAANETASMLYSVNMTDPNCTEMQWMMTSLDQINSFMEYTKQPTEEGGMYSPEALKEIYSICIGLLWLAFAMVPFGFSSFYFLSWTAQKQGTIIRTKYLEALLRQEVGWYDSKMSGALTSQAGEGACPFLATTSEHAQGHWCGAPIGGAAEDDACLQCPPETAPCGRYAFFMLTCVF